MFSPLEINEILQLTDRLAACNKAHHAAKQPRTQKQDRPALEQVLSGGISNPLTAIEQITYLLFMKRLDELDQKRQADAEWTGENYISKFAGS